MGHALNFEELFSKLTEAQKNNMAFVESFASWGEFLDAVDRPTDMNPRERASRENEEDKRWDLNAGFEGAKKLARNGWLEGSKDVIRSAVKFAEDLIGRIQLERWNYEVEASGNLDVARFLDGEPEAWLRITERETETKSATIVLNIGASGDVDAEVMKTRGVMAANIAVALEAAGVKTRIILAKVTMNHGSRRTEFYITLKEFGELLDIDSLIFALAHPATLRRLFFSYEETWEAKLRQEFGIGGGMFGGYGHSEESYYQGDIYFDKVRGYEEWAHSPKEMEKFIRKNLEKFGVHFTDDEYGKEEVDGNEE